MSTKPKYLASFARRVARTLGVSQKNYLKEYLPAIRLDLDGDFAKLRKGYSEVELEVGSGNGEFIIQLALNNPQKLFIACEPFINGVASLVKLTQENKVSNIRIFIDDARLFLDKMPDNYLAQVYIICPDPWPKRKQKKRRLINGEFLQLLQPKVCHNLLIVTDHEDYAGWILNELNVSQLFNFAGKKLEDFAKLPKNWLYTKYQRFGISLGSKIYYFAIKKGG